MKITATAIGRLIRKINRHETAVMRNPPTKGPRAVATPPSPDHAPMTRPRSSGANDASRMARLPGVSKAPPTPCSIRAAMSSPMLGAIAQISDATANHATPMTKIFRRPKRSQSAPARRMSPATVRRYPADTHCRPAIWAWNSLPIAGWAMPTTVASSCAIALPRTVAVSTHFPRAVARCSPPASSDLLTPAEDFASVITPLDVAVKARGFWVALIRGHPLATGGDRRGRAVAWEHDRFLRQWQQLGGDARHDRLKVPACRGLARPPVEERVAADQSPTDAQRDAAGRVAGRMDHLDPCAAHLHLGSIVETAVDALLGDPDLAATDQNGRTRGGAHRVVGHPVIGVPMGCDDGLDTALGRDRGEQRFFIGGHVDEHRRPGRDIAHHVRIVPVRPHRANLDDADAAVVEDRDLRPGHAPPSWQAASSSPAPFRWHPSRQPQPGALP